MSDSKPCHRVNWLKELKKEGLLPIAVVLAEIEGAWPWQIEERYWIAKLKQMGADLTNSTDGGDGVDGLPEETRKRMALTWTGRKHKPETIAKLKEARAKRVTSEATKRKMSATHKGREITWGATIAEATRKLSREQAEQIRHRIHSGETVISIAKETGIHRTTISKVKAGTYFVK